MRKLLIIPAVFLLLACDSEPKDASDLNLDDFEERISYALGADMGANFAGLPVEIYEAMDKQALEEGFYEMLTSEDKTTEACTEILNKAFSGMQGIDTTEHSMKEISHCYGTIFGEMMRKSLTSRNAMDQVNPNIIRIGFSNALVKTDTLIPIEERQKMIANFNNDLNKLAGEEFMTKALSKTGAKMEDAGYILIQNEGSEGEKLDLSKEFLIVYTMTNATGDTIISTVADPSFTEEENALIITARDIVLPEGWKLAADQMKVGGDYTIYVPYELGFGEEGMMNRNQTGYVIPPFSALKIHTKVLGQYELNSTIKNRGKKVIEEAKKEPNTVVGKSGYVLTTLEKGEGAKVPAGSDVQAHYILKNSKGETIENSYMAAMQQGRPAPTFSLDGVVKGWQEAIPEMRKGGRYKLVLPYDLAYGETGNQGIPPFETLIFEIEIVDFGKKGSLVPANPQMPQMPQGM
ncbi:MAG: FKBP-type peptidyl-prolyl cis-trans isomerase [Brumimicrobium sp.]|nr:FKBP-type peptidyl-prolyl cis-trans isomerase [Brumimicrobium sp.]